MTTPKAFKDLEAFSDYPSGYEPVVETQKQLIVQSMKKSKHQRHLAVILAIAASVVILVIGDRFSVIGDRGAVISGQRTTVSGQRTAISGQLTADSRQRSAVSGQRSADSRQPIVDSRQPIADSRQLTANNGQLTADSSQPKTKDQGPKTNSQPSTEFFITKQRFKQFEFNRPPEAVKRPQEEKKKTEFFVFQNGNFKIINRPNQSQNTVIYTK